MSQPGAAQAAFVGAALAILVAVLAAVGPASPALAHGSGDEEAALDIVLIDGLVEPILDIEVGGGRRYRRVSFGNMLFLGNQAGTTLDLVVKIADTDDVVFAAPIELPADDRFGMLLYTGADGAVLVTTFVNRPRPVPAGAGRLVVRHQGTVDDVDLVIVDGEPVVLGSISAGESDSVVLPIGDWPLEVGGSESVVASITEGDETVVYVIDDPQGGSLAVVGETVHDVEVDDLSVAPVSVAEAAAARSGNGWWFQAALALAAAGALGGAVRWYSRRRTDHNTDPAGSTR